MRAFRVAVGVVRVAADGATTVSHLYRRDGHKEVVPQHELVPERTCAVCAQVMTRRPSEAAIAFDSRTYCSRKCVREARRGTSIGIATRRVQARALV